ncbi:MAG TPA: hypothetical protein PKE29_03395 [Phycisphaerales bacterium]|nr:hypothetical protein [Phycisphaerales bacterium]
MANARPHDVSVARPARSGWTGALALAAAGVCGVAAFPAAGQLREQQTLVVYDSRIADSKAIAEFYAGSANVPGGAGSIAGVHSGVIALDISTLLTTLSTPAGVVGSGNSIVPDIDYPTFKTYIRDPLRAYLTSQGLERRVRCITLTRGIPHRVQQISTGANPLNPTIGDNPGMINNAFTAGLGGNLTYCSVDSELTLLHQSLDTGEAGNSADSKVDGMIVNPFWRATVGINSYTTRYIASAKAWAAPGGSNNGIWWVNGTNPALTTTLTPGAMYLVCRLDGNSVADVTGMITRAQNVSWPTLTGTFILDSDGSTLEGTGNPPALDGGADYTLARVALQVDARFTPLNAIKNSATGFTGFVVGPNADYSSATNGPPIVMSAPMLLVASYGANHNGLNGLNGADNGSNARITYGTSFNYLPGAVFNSIESYNGRAFGGLGQNPFVPQQQAADVLAGAAGATFAPCSAWEPLSISAPDNEQIAKNFFLGNMTWAEAAYTSLPALSWQQMVVGDPLARPRRDREDVNADGRVNIDDLYAFWAAPVDLNNNSVADANDFNLLEKTARGLEAAGMKGEQR